MLIFPLRSFERNRRNVQPTLFYILRFFQIIIKSKLKMSIEDGQPYYTDKE